MSLFTISIVKKSCCSFNVLAACCDGCCRCCACIIDSVHLCELGISSLYSCKRLGRGDLNVAHCLDSVSNKGAWVVADSNLSTEEHGVHAILVYRHIVVVKEAFSIELVDESKEIISVCFKISVLYNAIFNIPVVP